MRSTSEQIIQFITQTAVAFWDSDGRYQRASEWAFVKQLGHRDDLERWQGKGDDYFCKVPLKSLDGIAMGREYAVPTDG